MSLSSKDPRITELFTEGSHHRNLSVVAINQNLYYSKDPTQRRNYHYIILFNNPVDKQQVMTLGRQMYPEKPHHLVNHFNEAVSKPYGYLLVDLKPNTPEHSRLKSNIISKCISLPPSPSHHNYPCQQCSTEIPSVSNIGATLDHHSAQLFQPEQTCPGNMNACRDCGTLFQDMHHLYRHKHRHCQIRKKRLRDEDDITENDAFQKLIKHSRRGNEEEFNEKVTTLVNDGTSKSTAIRKIDKQLVSKDADAFIESYRDLLSFIIELQDSQIHQDILNEINELVARGRSVKSAIRRVVKLPDFEDLFASDSSDTNQSDDTDENEVDESSDYDRDDNLPLSELKKRL